MTRSGPMPPDDERHSNEEAATARLVAELRRVNERLLLAGLREQVLKDQLSDQLTFTQAITDTLSEGVCALDTQSRISFVNPTGAILLGWATTELRGRNFHDLVHAHESHDHLLRAVLQSGTTVRDDDVFMRRDGSVLPVAYSAAPILRTDEVVGMVVTFRDNTERKRLEAVQADRFDQVQIARTAAEAGMRTRTEVLETVSHDLRTPLTVILGRIQGARRRAAGRAITDHRAVDDLDQIETAARKMTTILDDLMDVAQLAAGHPLTLRRQPTNLVALIRRVMADQTSATRRRVIFAPPQVSLVGIWDASRLERVVTNLLTNAVKYSPDDRRIQLQLYSDATTSEWVVFTIQDEGIGIPAVDLPHIFERFFRASNADRWTVGNGLGLAGAKEIVEQHGGKISIASIEGSGTTVTVRLPQSHPPMTA